MYPVSEVLQNFKGRYAPLSDRNIAQYAENDSDVEDWQSTKTRQQDRSWRWITLSSFLAILNVAQLLRPFTLPSFGISHAGDAFSTGFSTDFGKMSPLE
jgi:hypothetical protein